MDKVMAARLDFAEALREFRLSLRFTQLRLARRLRVAAYTVNRWERGMNLPQPGHFSRMLELPYMREPFRSRLTDAYAIGYGRRSESLSSDALPASR